ncbi:MAG: hypothetical protein U0271_23805 [Polyangiaceae bacterium]
MKNALLLMTALLVAGCGASTPAPAADVTVDRSSASMRAELDHRLQTEKLEGLALVPSDVVLFSTAEAARQAKSTLTTKSDNLRAVVILADEGAVVKVRTWHSPRVRSGLRELTDYDLTLYANRAQLVPVLRRSIVRTERDGTGYILFEGLPVRVDESGNVRPTNDQVARFAQTLTTGDVALSFPLRGSSDPKLADLHESELTCDGSSVHRRDLDPPAGDGYMGLKYGLSRETCSFTGDGAALRLGGKAALHTREFGGKECSPTVVPTYEAPNGGEAYVDLALDRAVVPRPVGEERRRSSGRVRHRDRGRWVGSATRPLRANSGHQRQTEGLFPGRRLRRLSHERSDSRRRLRIRRARLHSPPQRGRQTLLRSLEHRRGRGARSPMKSLLRALVLVSAAACSSAPPVQSGTVATASAPSAPARAPADSDLHVSNPRTIALGGQLACAIRGDGRVACWGVGLRRLLGDPRLEPNPRIIPGVEHAVEVGVGAAHACARVEDGGVFCWGETENYLLGQPVADPVSGARRVPDVEQAVSLAVSDAHSCAVLQGGKLRCWGSPENGKLSLDHLDHVTEPANVDMPVERVLGVALTSQSTCVRDELGGVACWGIGDRMSSNELHPVDLAGVTELTAGVYQICATLKGGELRCFGSDGKPVVDPDIPPRISRLALGDGFGCGWRAAGPPKPDAPAPAEPASPDDPDAEPAPPEEEPSSEPPPDKAGFACWGSILAAPYRYGAYGGRQTTLRIYDELAGATELRAGVGVACARAASGEVLCWGDNDVGLLGRPMGGVYTRPVAVTSASPAVSLVANGSAACSIGADGKIRCWGEAPWLRPYQPSYQLVEHASAIAIGQHACAVHDKGKVACWGPGDAQYGELGAGPGRPPPPKRKKGKGTPRDTTEFGMVGLFGGSLGADYVAEVEGLPAATAVAVTTEASCALTAKGVYCWGGAAERTGDSFMIGGGPCSPYGNYDEALCKERKKPRLVTGTAGAKRIVSRGGGFCALQATGKVDCWTSSGTPTTVENLENVVSLHPVSESAATPFSVPSRSEDTVALTSNGELYRWGVLPSASLDGIFVEPIVDWAGADTWGCALTKTNTVLCFGAGDVGQLGNGVMEFSDHPVRVDGLGEVVALAAGGAFACALDRSGAVSCWGSGDAQMDKPDSTFPYSLDPVSVNLDSSR